jgi:hypothetical protein
VDAKGGPPEPIRLKNQHLPIILHCTMILQNSAPIAAMLSSRAWREIKPNGLLD